MKATTLLFVLIFAALWACDEPDIGCLGIEEISTHEIPPAGVRTVFKLSDCDGEPIADLRGDELTLLLDGKDIQSEGEVAPIVTQEVDFIQDALILLDLSDSIIDNGSLAPMVEAARRAASSLAKEGQQVAIYQFAGPTHFGEVQGFTGDEALLSAAFDKIASNGGLGTTDLYGSIVKAIDILNNLEAPDILQARTLVLFTDGTDEAMEMSRTDAREAINRSDVHVFTVGLGGDVNIEELQEFGQDGFEWSADVAELDAAFQAIAERITATSHSYYLLGVCSPRTKGLRSMTLRIEHLGEKGEKTVHYDATGFDIATCSTSDIAFPCKDIECGTTVDGLFCGGCPALFECGEHNTCEPKTPVDVPWTFVPGGDFTLGCTAVQDPACQTEAEARRRVRLSDYWLAETEITVAMYEACVKQGGCAPSHLGEGELCNFGLPGREAHPINCIDWAGLREFCIFLGGDLPTEAEWERAYRGDHDGVLAEYSIYPWGNAPPPSCTLVVMDDGGLGCGALKTARVGTLPAQSFGLFDMAGNLSEWVRDYYTEEFADCLDDLCIDEAGPSEGSFRVQRGGSANDMYASAFRTAAREQANPSTKSPLVGGRCVLRSMP